MKTIVFVVCLEVGGYSQKLWGSLLPKRVQFVGMLLMITRPVVRDFCVRIFCPLFFSAQRQWKKFWVEGRQKCCIRMCCFKQGLV